MRVAVIIPSRGLIFSRTAEEILNNLNNIPHKLYFAHKLPLPECFETPTEEALKDSENTHFWFVEEDMVIPSNTLQNMLFAHEDVVAIDYPVSKKGQGSVFRDQGGNVVFCGTGCLLVTRKALEAVGRPYWRSDIRWTVANYGSYLRFTAGKNNFDNYGLHDVNFGIRLWKKGIKIRVIESTLGQRKLVALGKTGTNNGAHLIETWTKVKKDFLLKEYRSWPVMPTGELVEVTTPTGDIMVSRTHAKTLKRKGLAKPPEKKYITIDDSGLL